MHDSVNRALDRLAADGQFRILYACESGSRAWGFASPDSDYDVRFVYVPRLSWYLKVKPDKDTYECMLPNDLDMSGWELRKILHHFGSSNLTLYEWFSSPIIYRDCEFAKTLRDLIPQFFNARKAMHHYVSMARRIAEDHLAEHIGIKKLFYIIRPLYACQWIDEHRSMPSTLYKDLYKRCSVSPTIQNHIQPYLTLKQDAVEGHQISLHPELKEWMEQQLDHFEAIANTIPTPENQPFEELDRILYETVTSKI